LSVAVLEFSSQQHYVPVKCPIDLHPFEFVFPSSFSPPALSSPPDTHSRDCSLDLSFFPSLLGDTDFVTLPSWLLCGSFLLRVDRNVGTQTPDNPRESSIFSFSFTSMGCLSLLFVLSPLPFQFPKKKHSLGWSDRKQSDAVFVEPDSVRLKRVRISCSPFPILNFFPMRP